MFNEFFAESLLDLLGVEGFRALSEDEFNVVLVDGGEDKLCWGWDFLGGKMAWYWDSLTDLILSITGSRLNNSLPNLE